MPELITLSRRVTHRYVGTWRHLDEWRTICTAKMLGGHRIVDHGNGYEYGKTRAYTVIAPRGIDAKAFKRALEDEYSAWGCAHSYDCCGCASYSATAKRIKGRRWRLLIKTSYNY